MEQLVRLVHPDGPESQEQLELREVLVRKDYKDLLVHLAHKALLAKRSFFSHNRGNHTQERNVCATDRGQRPTWSPDTSAGRPADNPVVSARHILHPTNPSSRLRHRRTRADRPPD